MLTSIKTVARRRARVLLHRTIPPAAVPSATSFTDPVAVETWDASFRWRTPAGLRDVTIDDTWARVADAVAAANGSRAAQWARRYVDAFSRWRLLPDERLLRDAGTGNPLPALDAPSAVLNAGCFVTAPFGARPRFDRDAFVDTATLAVRLLDDALLCAPPAASGTGLRIGMLGFDDLLRKLGIGYTDAASRELARDVAAALAEGTLRGAVELAEERGSQPVDANFRARWEPLGLPAGLIERVLRSGLRHQPLTAIDSHPLLAQLANGATDALDPGPERAGSDVERAGSLVALRAEMQPWIDAPIGAHAVTTPDAFMTASVAHAPAVAAGEEPRPPECAIPVVALHTGDIAVH